MQTEGPSRQEEKPRFTVEPATADPSAVSSSVFSLLPDPKIDPMTERAAGLVSITDAAAAYGQNPYYNSSYTAGYGMYGSNPASYYQQVASGLRAQNAAAFPYSIGAAAQTAYYGGSYPASLNFNDYSAYNTPYYNGMRTAGYYGNALTAGAAYAGAALTGDTTTDLNGFSLKDKKNKCSKKKKSGSCSPGDSQYARVFIWDLNDICPFSSANLDNVAHKAPHLSRSALLLKQVTSRAVSLSFSAEQLEEFDLGNVEDAALEDNINDGSIVDGRGGVEVMRRLASKYYSLRQLYQEFACKTESVCSYGLIDRCGMGSQREEIVEAARQIDAIYSSRTEAARRCLDLVMQRSAASMSEKYANVVMCSDGLVSAVSQLLLAGEASSIPIENVYSASKSGKESALDRIQNRFGKKCSYVVVSSNVETTLTAKKECVPVWPVISTDDLDKLYTAQSLYLLGSSCV